jgi:hypothetical protein
MNRNYPNQKGHARIKPAPGHCNDTQAHTAVHSAPRFEPKYLDINGGLDASTH